MKTQTEQLLINGRSGRKLAARLNRPSDRPLARALFTHCFTCSKDYHAVSRISRGLANRGIAVLRFDFTGLGESEGDFADTNFSSNLEDVIAAAQFLNEHFGSPEPSHRPQPGRIRSIGCCRFHPGVRCRSHDCSAFGPSAPPADSHEGGS